jgi:hypothetical protein
VIRKYLIAMSSICLAGCSADARELDRGPLEVLGFGCRGGEGQPLEGELLIDVTKYWALNVLIRNNSDAPIVPLRLEYEVECLDVDCTSTMSSEFEPNMRREGEQIAPGSAISVELTLLQDDAVQRVRALLDTAPPDAVILFRTQMRASGAWEGGEFVNSKQFIRELKLCTACFPTACANSL